MIGIDVVSIKRIQHTFQRYEKRFLNRFLSQAEQKLCYFEDLRPNFERIAGFWASKEAISKALGTGIGEKLGFLDICLSRNTSGQPLATLHSNKMQEFQISQIALSITHDVDLAIAVAFVS